LSFGNFDEQKLEIFSLSLEKEFFLEKIDEILEFTKRGLKEVFLQLTCEDLR